MCFRSKKKAVCLLACLQGNATEYERAVFGTLSAMVGEEGNEEVALERHFEVVMALSF